MKILVLNSGSSSLKFKLYAMPEKSILAEGLIERIGEEESPLHIEYGTERYERNEKLKDHADALRQLEKLLPELDLIRGFDELAAVGHRVVHGGEAFSQPVLIDGEVTETIRKLIPLAPLHNPANLLGIEAMRELDPSLPQVAVFDTAFHQSMEAEAYRYALPNAWYEKYGVRRYGFHGTSHYYVSRRVAELMGKKPEVINTITLHLGNGASACAVRGGKSVETSMGLTPLEGLVMGTRSGDIDPAIIFYMNQYGKMDLEEINRELNKASGLKGLAGSNDMRQIQEAMEEGDASAKLAFEVFIHRLLKYVGAYAATLGRLDALVFTGGIGEHSAAVRKALCERLGILGIALDEAANLNTENPERSIHSKASGVEVWVVPTDEEGVIAEESYRLIGEKRV